MAKKKIVRKSAVRNSEPMRRPAARPERRMRCTTKNMSSGCGGFFYFMGFIGAAVYYIGHATSFWGGIVGLAKAIFWPAFLVYGLLKNIGV